MNLIDTADSYGPEVSENLIAEALHPYPDDLVIATKGGLRRTGPGQWPRDARPERLKECCEGSLRRLRVDRIDLYQLHAPDPKVPLEDSLGALKELQDEGKIRHIGVSNVSVDELERARALVDVVTVQNRYNLVDRHSEDVLEACERDGHRLHPVVPAGHRRPRPARRVRSTSSRALTTPRRASWRIAWLLARSPVDAADPGHRVGSSTSRRTSPPRELRLEPPGARAPRRRRLIAHAEGVNEPSCHARSAPRASTTWRSGWTSAQALATFLCDHLGMHVIEETDTFTLVGVDAKLGKLTLFDAGGPARARRARAHRAARGRPRRRGRAPAQNALSRPRTAWRASRRPAGCRWRSSSATASSSTSTTWCCACPIRDGRAGASSRRWASSAATAGSR